MATNTKIQWSKHTWNPIWGCSKVSPGCKFCYAERVISGQYKDSFAPRRTKPVTFNWPLQFHKALTGNEPFQERLVFSCSMSDWFIEFADPFRDEMWDIIRRTPNLIYQILTKREERVADCLPDDWGDGYDNVWLGFSAENQAMYERRISYFKDIPAKVKFISAEPLIGRINMSYPKGLNDAQMCCPGTIHDACNCHGHPCNESLLSLNGIDWVIVGGESGNKSGKYQFRECKESWVCEIISDCELSGVPVFVKQLGTHLKDEMKLKGKHGGDMEEWPEYLQVREWPLIY